ncbi:MAG: hypothetical protein KDH88_18630 [Chromatiales bacterium]|nr:hypothetical protein [Chromatiales bacterium]
MTTLAADQDRQIDAEAFFREFLPHDPKYAAVIAILDTVREPMRRLLDRDELPLSEFIDLISVEYDDEGNLKPKEEDALRRLARAMKRSDVSRETLLKAASAGLTQEQIEEGPTSIKIPVSVLTRKGSFRRFIQTLSPAYGNCATFAEFLSTSHELRVHQKPVFLLFSSDDTISGFYSPEWSMQEMRTAVALSPRGTLKEIYNAKRSLRSFAECLSKYPKGHVKIIYVGTRTH